MQAIKDENLKLVNKINDKKTKLTSLRFLINKKDNGQVKHFNDLVEIDESTDYTDLYYKSGNKRKDDFDFEKYGTMTDLFQTINSERRTLENLINADKV